MWRTAGVPRWDKLACGGVEVRPAPSLQYKTPPSSPQYILSFQYPARDGCLWHPFRPPFKGSGPPPGLGPIDGTRLLHRLTPMRMNPSPIIAIAIRLPRGAGGRVRG